MPKQGRKASKKDVEQEEDMELMKDDMLDSQDSEDKDQRKRSHDQDEDFPGEVENMLKCFGADIQKTMLSKRKRLEQFTSSSLKTSNKKVENIWTSQQSERVKLSDEFNKQLTGVFGQWEQDISKAKEQEDKLLTMFQQQQKLLQQTRIVQAQRLKTIKQLHEQYFKGMEGLEKHHQTQQTNVHSELKKEMALLQKKILMDTQQQEMANVRKSLQTMLY